MPGDVEFGQFKPDLVPRELRDIIDKITTGGYKSKQYAAMGQAANSIAGLQEKRLGVASETSKAGLVDTGLTTRLGMENDNKLQIKGMDLAQANKKYTWMKDNPSLVGGVGGTAGAGQTPPAATPKKPIIDIWGDENIV
jgi:hypothetical protein